MKVSLINVTPYALETLIFTKSTRLKMSATSLEEIIAWPEDRKMAEWDYMQNTIRSSWEFVDYVFLIEGVSRAFTHQLVRHRIGTSFAQQSQRTVDMSEFEYVTPDALINMRDCGIRSHAEARYDQAMAAIDDDYQDLIKAGLAPEDARGVLPTNVSTNIVFKANLRTLNGMAAERLCVKAQGEFQTVMYALREAVVAIHPWAEPALRVYCAQHGICAFPTYTKCLIQHSVFNPETGMRHDGHIVTERQDGGWGRTIEYPAPSDSKRVIQAHWVKFIAKMGDK